MSVLFEKKEKKSAVSFYLSRNLINKIREISKKEGVNISEVAEKFISLGMDEYTNKLKPKKG